MILIINRDNRVYYNDLLNHYSSLRNTVFNGRLYWDLRTVGDHEEDDYDRDDSIYLICYNREIGVYGGCRLLPTTSPYMLKNTFTEVICDRPECDEVWESSRFCIDHTVRTKERIGMINKQTYELIAGMIEFGINHGLHNIITLTTTSIERVFRIADIPLERLSENCKIGKTIALAANINIRPEYLLYAKKKAGIVGNAILSTDYLGN